MTYNWWNNRLFLYISDMINRRRVLLWAVLKLHPQSYKIMNINIRRYYQTRISCIYVYIYHVINCLLTLCIVSLSIFFTFSHLCTYIPFLNPVDRLLLKNVNKVFNNSFYNQFCCIYIVVSLFCTFCTFCFKEFQIYYWICWKCLVFVILLTSNTKFGTYSNPIYAMIGL